MRQNYPSYHHVGTTSAVLIGIWFVCVAWILAALLSGCTTNYRSTEITMTAGADMTVDASGATNRTDTGQATDADLSPLVDAAKEAIKGKTSGIIDRVKDFLGSDDDTDPLDADVTADPAAVSPAGIVEEVD